MARLSLLLVDGAQGTVELEGDRPRLWTHKSINLQISIDSEPPRYQGIRIEIYQTRLDELTRHLTWRVLGF